jgi:hypothetical protein
MFDDAGKWKIRLKANREAFLEALDRVAKLDSEEKTFRVERAKGAASLLIKSSSASVSFAEEIDYDGPDEEIAEELLIGSIQPFLSAASGDTVSMRWNPGTSYLVQVAGSKRLLVTPRRRA